MANSTQAGGRIIAIVEDDASLRRSIGNFLMSVGRNAQTFESADAFLASEIQDETCCLVLDLQMPGMTGLELLEHLNRTGRTIPVIVTTAHPEHRERALAAGAKAFLTKPCRVDALLEAIEALSP